MASEHDEVVRRQFRVQAASFTDHGFAVRGLDWIVRVLGPSAQDVVLDVACGAGHLGRALAPLVTHVSALDLTPEMLHQGQRLAIAAGVRNVSFLEGDAAALPWCDDQFDLVACRLALHQVADPAAVVREMVRVARPTGRVAVIDMTADEDPAVRAETDRLERLRDPSHGRTLTVGEIEQLLGAAGADPCGASTQDQPLDLEDWLARTATPEPVRADIRQRLDDELRGGPRTGLRPDRRSNGAVTIVHPWVIVPARAR